MNTFARTLVGGLLTLSGAMSGAHAGILGFGNHASSEILTGTEQRLPLTNSGAEAITFRTEANNTFVVVTYSAECQAYGEPGDYGTIRVAVDGIDALPRAGVTFALCSAADPVSEVGSGVLRQAFLVVPRAGTHRVEIFATAVLVSGASRIRLQNTSTVIQD